VKDANLLLKGDSEKNEIAVRNLMENATTYTSEGGHVFIVAEQIPRFAKISIVDDGVGVLAKDLPHIFERFYQAESHLTRQHGGMDLGFSVSKVMIELHDGRIWAESIPDRGSQFAFLLLPDRGKIDAAQRIFQV